MELKKIAAGVGLSLLTLNAHADYIVDMQVQFSVGSGEFENDDYDYDIDTDSRSLNAKVHFGKVDTSTSPFREASFLSKKSSLAYGYTDSTIEYPDFDGELDNTITQLDGRFVIPGPNLIILAGLSQVESDPSLEADGKTIGLGVYINDQGALTARYSVYEWENDQYPWLEIDDTKIVNIDFRQVKSLNEGQHIAFFGSLGREDDGSYNENFLSGGATWYLNQKFGVGARLTLGSGSGEDYDSFSAAFTPHISYDFNEQVGVYGQLTSSATAIEEDDGDEVEGSFLGLTAGVNVRF